MEKQKTTTEHEAELQRLREAVIDRVGKFRQLFPNTAALEMLEGELSEILRLACSKSKS